MKKIVYLIAFRAVIAIRVRPVIHFEYSLMSCYNSISMTKIRTRFAPSPTGDPHIGHLRTCAYAYALSKHNSGDFILRIEDTDQRRYKPESLEILKRMVKDFGMNWDEFYIQSERAKEGIYIQVAEKLVVDGKAFYCDCGPRNAKEEGYSSELRDPCRDKGLKSGAIKLKIPDNEKISYHDYVLDRDITWDSGAIADTTLLKSEDLKRLPTYHLAVVVDDNDMKITHVLRGHDWMPSTPIHLLVYKYLGYEIPEIGHLTDIQSPEGGKLSKRKGSTSIQQLLEDGYLKEAIFNFTILLGWAPKDNRELFTLDEFVKAFDPKGFQKSNPIFNKEKLDWFNGEYIRQKSDTELLELLKPFTPKNADKAKLMQIIPLIKDRIKKLSDFDPFAGFFFTRPNVDRGLLGKNHEEHLAKALEAVEKGIPLDQVPKDNNFKVGDFFMDLRVAITGSKFTPPINESIEILGKEETLDRLRKVLE